MEQEKLENYLCKTGPRDPEVYTQALAGHARLVAGKDKAAKFLLQVKTFHQKYGNH